MRSRRLSTPRVLTSTQRRRPRSTTRDPPRRKSTTAAQRRLLLSFLLYYLLREGLLISCPDVFAWADRDAAVPWAAKSKNSSEKGLDRFMNAYVYEYIHIRQKSRRKIVCVGRNWRASVVKLAEFSPSNSPLRLLWPDQHVEVLAGI
jgi:hypothetical protein